MRKFFSLLMMMFASIALVFADEPVQIASGTFNGKNATYTEGWTTTGTGVSRTDCIIIGADESITSPEVDLSQYESISVAIKARRFGTLSGSKAEIAVTFDGEAIGNTVASGTSATTALDVINYEVSDLSTGNFVVTCSNATSAGSTHGAGINSIVITGVLKSQQGGGEDPQPTHTYTVAGDNADLFGTTWAPTNTDNDMTLVEGVYTWEKTNMTMPAGNVAFKVVEDHSWDNASYPSDNYVLNIPEGGVYTITITYNPADNNAVNAVAQKTGSAVVIPTVAMHGNFTGNWGDTENFAVADGNATASITLNLAAGDYEFGMRIGGSSNWTANGAAFTRENNAAVIVAGQGNITLDADAAGEYTFTWTYETNTLTITYPEFVPPTYTYADGYYLIGLDMQDWTMEYMPTEGRLFAANPDNEGEYQLTITLAVDQQFKVVYVQKDQIKNWYPDGMDNNYIVDAAHAGEKTVYFRPDGQGGQDWHYGCIYVAANEDQPEQPTGNVIYNWSNVEAEQVGTTILGAAGVSIENVKIHTNADNVPGIKFGNSYNYADGKWIAIKPAKGGFKAGDKVNIAICFNNSDDTKQAQVKAFAADGATELFLTAQGINGRSVATDPVVETFTLAADQDSILLGRYGNTATFITTLNVTRVGGDEPIETPKFYITGNAALVGQDKEWNPGAIPSMEDSKVLALEAGSYMMKITTNGAWEGENNVKGYDALTGEIPAGVTRGENENNDNICFTLAEAGDVTVTYTAESFTIAGNFYVAPKVAYYLIGDSAFVVDAGATADKAWTPDAIPSFQDTTVLNLKAGVDYIMRLSLEGTWENHRDFRHLTDTAAGLIELPDEFGNHSIGFQLAEAGEVTIIYIPATNEQPEVFKLIGNFYVAPAPDPTVAVMGSMNDWAEEIPFVLSDDKTYASLTVENITAGDYEFKFIINGEWRSNGYRFHREFTGAAGITENNKANMVFVADQDGEYTFYWYFANDSAAIVYPEYIEPAKEYYAKYAPAWEWVKLTEAEGLWLTDTIVYKGTGININDKADDENNMFYSNTVEEEGVRSIAGAEIDVNDTIRFSFNPADSVVTAIMIAEYVAPDPTASVRLEIMEWDETPFILAADKQSASLTIEDIHKGNYAFKMFINGEWRSNAGTISRENPAAIVAGNEDGNMTLKADIDGIYTFKWFFANDSLVAIFPEKPEVPMTEIRLVPGVWNVDGAKFAAVTWNEGEVMEDGVVSDWFVGTDTVVGNIPAAADSIGFARFNGEAAAPSIEDQSIIWNHTDKMLIDKETMIYTITGWPEEGKDYCPGYWGAPYVPVLENGFYLVGNKYNWTPAAEHLFTANPETEGEYFLAEVTLEENDSIKVVMVVNDEITDWYPNGDNYVVDAAHAGVKDIYFNPTYQEAWGNNIYIEANAAPFACDWENIKFLGSTEPKYANQFKLCKEGEYPGVVNIQNSFGTEPGIYVTFPSAAFGEISLPEGKYAIQGAGMLLYCSAFVEEYTEVTIVCDNNPIVFTVYNAANAPQPAQPEYFLVGTMNNWQAAEAYKFGKDETCADGEFVLHADLAEGDEIKVIGVLGNDTTWFPAEAGNYSIDDAHAGEAKAIYFRPQYHADWAAFGGYFWIGENQALLDAPDAAPAAPTYAGYQVHAAYSATYNADCNFGEWGSGTQYTQEEFGKKYVTTNMGYFGLEFTGMDCSEMEALHLDVWVAADASIRIVPIHGGTEVGVTAQLQGQQWNAIDIALTEFAGVTNWSNVYQIKIDNASNLTFWLNNVYFYTTQEKTVDLVDGYYLIGNINGWDIHNLTADHLFAVNPENEAEYVLHYTLAEGNEFKVVSVANNELGAWYPGEAGNYVVDFAHAGENDIYFRPDYQGGEGWHAGCIYVAVDESHVNPWETWFAVGDTWNTETESYLEWDGENQKATIHINVDKYGQWRAQAKYHGPAAEAGKCYRVALKMKANHAINNVTIKYQDNVEMVYVNDAALAANVEFVFDTIVAGLPNGNGIMVLDFGFAHAGDIIEIYDVVIEETECPATRLEDGYYLIGLGMADWTVDYITADYLFTANPSNEGEYMLNITLAKDQQFKVVGVANDAIVTWYPGGMDNNYIVDENHYGATTVYFRPDGQGGEGWHYGMIYVAPVDHTAIDTIDANAPAVKILRDGQILIIKGEKMYNAQGQIVK